MTNRTGRYKTQEKNRGREEVRIVSVYKSPKELRVEWAGIRSLIKVERQVTRKIKGETVRQDEEAYFISSLPPEYSVREIANGIRGHWGIENSLHYTKDVTFKEDASKIRTGAAPENISLIRNMALNIFRNAGYENIAQSINMIAHDIPKLARLILE